jgi:putative Mg2+ transporter-C (MgtC) family protein
LKWGEEMIWWEPIIRVLIALFLGGLIGIQREYKHNAAGLRTHALVAIGACVAMITNEYLFLKYSGQSSMDIARMGSYVISGIGFLGAGSILKDGNRIRGLTTAAGLWVVACLGVAVGAGYYVIAIVGTVLVFFVIFILKIVENKFISKKDCIKIELEISHKVDQLAVVLAAIAQSGVGIRDIKISNLDKERKHIIIYTTCNSADDIANLLESLGSDDTEVLSITKE